MSPIRRLLRLARPHRWWLALAILAAAGALIANVLLMTAAPYLISRAAIVVEFAALSLAVTAVRAFALSRAGLRYVERLVTHVTALRIITTLRVAIYEGLERLSPGGLPERRTGDVLARVDADVHTLNDFFVRGIVPPAAAAAAIAVAAVVLATLNPVLAATMFVAAAVAGLVVPLSARAASRRTAARLIEARGSLHAELTEQIHGMADLIAFGAAPDALADTASIGAELDLVQRRLHRIGASASATVVLVSGLAAVIVLAEAIPLVRDGSIQGVLLAIVPLVTLAAFEGVLGLGEAFRQIEVSRAAATRTFELMDAPPVVVEPAAPVTPPSSTYIRFEHVSFRYAPDTRDVLDDLSFDLVGGEHLALVGPSGAGKTTVASLLLRFWEPTAGHIEIGGVDIAATSSEDVRALIGVVPQDPYLFNGTLRDNLLLADGSADDERILDACRRAQLGAFIEALPRGLDTAVGENGRTLSGGERQRVAIARLYLRNAPIAILDEATANLDPKTERAVIGELGAFTTRKTAIVITHRSALLELADRAIHFDLSALPA